MAAELVAGCGEDAVVETDCGWDCGVAVVIIGCCTGVLKGLLSGVTSGEEDMGTYDAPAFDGACCDCSAIGAMENVIVGDVCEAVAADPATPTGGCNGLTTGIAAEAPCDVNGEPVTESDCCKGVVREEVFPA